MAACFFAKNLAEAISVPGDVEKLNKKVFKFRKHGAVIFSTFLADEAW